MPTYGLYRYIWEMFNCQEPFIRAGWHRRALVYFFVIILKKIKTLANFRSIYVPEGNVHTWFVLKFLLFYHTVLQKETIYSKRAEMQLLKIHQFFGVSLLLLFWFCLFFKSNPSYSARESAQLLVYKWQSSLDSAHKSVKAIWDFWKWTRGSM